MTTAAQLLKQIRRATATVNQGTTEPGLKSLLESVDICASALDMEDAPDFYLDHLARGKVLLKEGGELAAAQGQRPAPASALREDVDAGLRMEILQAEIDKLNAALVAIVNVLDEGRSPAEKQFLERLSDWESGLYNRYLEHVSRPATVGDERITPATVAAYLAEKFPQWKNLRVVKLTPLVGGFSKKTILLETEDDVNGRQEMVMRAEQPVDLLCYGGSDVTREFALIRYMRTAGLPIAEPLWLEADREKLGTRFIVSRRATGKTFGGNLGSDENISPQLLQSMLETFVQLHKVKIDADNPDLRNSHIAEWLPCRESLEDTNRYLATQFFPGLVQRTGIPMSPQLARGIKWMADNVPPSDEPPVIIHVDFALNNLIIDKDRISALLDWESSRLGDPAEDIIWTQRNLAAYIDLPQFLEFYRSHTGRNVTEERLSYAKVAKCVLNAIACLSSLHALKAFDSTHINASVLAYKYLALFGSQFNQLIAETEQARKQA